MDPLARKILENAKLRRAQRQQSTSNKSPDKENSRKPITPLIKKFEDLKSDVTSRSPSHIPESTLSVRKRIQFMESRYKEKDVKTESPTDFNQISDSEFNETFGSSSTKQTDQPDFDQLGETKHRVGGLKRKSDNSFTSGDVDSPKLKALLSDDLLLSSCATDLTRLSPRTYKSSIDSEDFGYYPVLPDESSSIYQTTEGSGLSFPTKAPEMGLPKPVSVKPVEQSAEGHAKVDIVYPTTPNTPKILVSENKKVENIKLEADSEVVMALKIPSTALNRRNTLDCFPNRSNKESVSSEDGVKVGSHTSLDTTELCVIHNAEQQRHTFVQIKKCLAENQNIISQTSQALNLSEAQDRTKRLLTSETIEAERLLLLATQKRNYFREQEQLLTTRQLPCTCSTNDYDFRVDLTVKDLSLYIKSDCLSSKELGAYFFCFLVSIKQHIYATNAVGIMDVVKDALNFKGVFNFHNVSVSDHICIQLYAFCHSPPRQGSTFKLKKLKIPRLDLTPKGSRFFRKFSAVDAISCNNVTTTHRSSSFAYVGEVSFSADRAGLQRLTLTNIVFDCPVTGSLSLQVTSRPIDSCCARGFLTVFTRGNKSNVWERCWCGLFRSHLSLWQYPIDEETKPPLRTIRLRWAEREQSLRLIPRNECARSHTFEIKVTEVDPNKVQCFTITSILLSADSREERAKWIEALKLHIAQYVSSRQSSFPFT